MVSSQSRQSGAKDAPAARGRSASTGFFAACDCLPLSGTGGSNGPI